ncbi:MAG: hypothetical protein JWO95_1801 [Verrucomicrobiales bacterium]|nr:hypothetical protein [Verrucomicrobiales bacterium]
MKFKVQNLRFKVFSLGCVFAVLASVSGKAATTNTVQSTNAPAPTSTTNPATGTDFPSFKIIAQRNIFSANRSGRVASGPTRKPTKVDTFTLVGTIDYAKGMFAIFDGSSGLFRKTLKVGDSLAGFTITDIDLDHVAIATTNGADTVLRVGTQMRRVDEGEWAVGSGPAPQIAKATSESTDEKADAAPSGEKSDGSDEAPPSAETNDILKKLMQKRKAEVKNEAPE